MLISIWIMKNDASHKREVEARQAQEGGVIMTTDKYMNVIQVAWIDSTVVRKNEYSIRNIPTGGWNDSTRKLYQYASLEAFFDHANQLWEITDCEAVYFTYENKIEMVAVAGRYDGTSFLWLLTYQQINLDPVLSYVHAIDTGKRLQRHLEWTFQLDEYPQWREWTKGNHPVYPGGGDTPKRPPLYIRLWNWLAPRKAG